MATRSPLRDTRPGHPPVARDKFRYEAGYVERPRPLRIEDEEPVLGPYETRRLIDMGYTAAPRTVS